MSETLSYEVFLEQGTDRVAQLPYTFIDATLLFNQPSRVILQVIPELLESFDLFGAQYRVVLRRNGQSLFSGFLSSVEHSWGPSDESLTLSLLDDLSILSKRIVVPVPAGPPYSTSDYDVRTGAIETVIYNYVKFHAGSSAKTSRQVEGLSCSADLGRGRTITARARFTPLLPLIQYLAELGNFGLRMLDRVFEVYQPADSGLSFSREMGNLTSFKRIRSLPPHNYVYVGGAGEGSSRVIVEVEDEDSRDFCGRREEWKDTRSTSDSNEMTDQGNAMLASSARESLRISWEAIATLDEIHLGDLVTLAFKGETYLDLIRSVRVRTDGVSEEVTISSGADQLNLSAKLDRMEGNLRMLEVR